MDGLDCPYRQVPINMMEGKKSRDNGSPCLSPRAGLKGFDATPLIRMLVFSVTKIIESHRLQLGPKPRNFNMDSRKHQDTVSRALEMSSFKRIISSFRL